MAVPDMTQVATVGLGLEVVHWAEISTDLSEIDAQRDAPSVQAAHNGMGVDHKREGVVLRPPIEVIKNNGQRIIAKHKRDDFAERTTPQGVTDPARLQVLTDARAIADEWVTPMRLAHVLDKLPAVGIEGTREVITAMVADITREAAGEVVLEREAVAAIGRRTATLFKTRLKDALRSE